MKKFGASRLAFVLVLGVIVLFLSCDSTPSVLDSSRQFPVIIPYGGAVSVLEIKAKASGMVRVAGYGGDNFVEGDIEYNVAEWQPRLEQEDGLIRLSQAENLPEKAEIPEGFINLWNLRLGDKQSFQLRVRTDNNEGHWNFSGLPITGLDFVTGTGRNGITFDDLNPEVMDQCSFIAGDGNVTMEGLLNFNFQNLAVRGGFGLLTLRFNGIELQRKAGVSIEGGVGDMVISIPQRIPACIMVNGSAQVLTGGVFNWREGRYETLSYHADTLKTLELNINAGSGIIHLESF
jgi:hypothetical protein